MACLYNKISQMNKKQQQQKNKTVPLPDYPLCSQIALILPQSLCSASRQDTTPTIDETYLKHYIKALLLKKKIIKKADTINLMFLGKQINILISSISGLSNRSIVKKAKAIVKNEEKNTNQRGRERPTKKKEVSSSESDESATQQVQPEGYSINTNTEIVFIKQEQKRQISQVEEKVCQFYGDKSVYNQMKESIIQNFKMRENLFKIKLGPIRGILLGGATGTGKTTYIRKLKSDLVQEKIHICSISSTKLLSRVVGGAEETVRNLFKDLLQHEKSCLFIEDMHLLFGQKEIASNQTTLVTLFHEMDHFFKPLLVLGTYNSERQLSRTVYQSGHFQKQIILNLPNHKQRFQILKEMLSQVGDLTDDEIRQFNLRLNGFSIGQIKQILRDAYIKNHEKISKDLLIEVLKNYRPSEIKELIVQVPEVYWDGIGGYHDVKKQIRKVTQLPLKHPEKFEMLNITPSKGVLLYGPPGCSKTMMAKAIATESKLNFIGIKGPELFSKYVGESQRAIRNIFRKARAFSPCIIFFDEIDALASQRNQQSDVTNRVLGQLLTEMDGVQGLKQVIIIAATNRPQILDQALTRPGRFDHLIYIGPPDALAREQIFQISLKKTPLEENIDEICKNFSKATQNYTGAEITLVCREAALEALEQNFENPKVSSKHIEKALQKIKSRLDRKKVHHYEQFNARFRGASNQSKPPNKQQTTNIFSSASNFSFTGKQFGNLSK